MKFKVAIGSDLFDKLMDLYIAGQIADRAAKTWILKRFGGRRPYANPSGALWGGIKAVQLPAEIMGWKPVGPGKYRLFEPKLVADKNAIAALPVVDKDEFKELIGYGNYPGLLGINTIPGLQFGETYALIDIPDHVRGYQELEDMEEILGSEYNRLFDQAEEYKAKPHPLKVAAKKNGKVVTGEEE